MALTCELCGSTNFVKDAGMFVCQGCGTKYTLQEAQRMMSAAQQAQAYTQPVQQQYVQPVQQQYVQPVQQQYVQQQPYVQQPYVQPVQNPMQQQQSTIESALNAVASVAAAAISSTTVQAPVLNTAQDFRPSAFNVSTYGARETNNYACRAWQMLLADYEREEHPSETRQKVLITRARECLTLLDDAAMLEPHNHVLGVLIYQNCKELVESAKHTYHYEKDSEGKWKRKSLDFQVKVEVPGQRTSFSQKATDHRKYLEQEYLDAHPDEVLQRERLVAQAEEINGRLSVLKSEKSSHGFFDFSGKREVKDRMKPVEAELSEVRSQISALDRKVDAYVDGLVRELGHSLVMLDF